VVLADLGQVVDAAHGEMLEVAAQVAAIGAQRIRGDPAFDRQVIEISLQLTFQRWRQCRHPAPSIRPTPPRAVPARILTPPRPFSPPLLRHSPPPGPSRPASSSGPVHSPAPSPGRPGPHRHPAPSIRPTPPRAVPARIVIRH